MKIKFGALVVAGRGKIGGHVASRNRSGAYLRTKVTPVNPATIAQQNVRNRFAGISSGWRGLTEPQHTSWNQSVHEFAKTDIFGDLRNPTGMNLHQRLNNNLVNIGKAQITVPPLVEAVDANLTLSVAAAEAAGTVTLTYTDPIAADHSVLVFATHAVSPGVHFVKSEYRQIAIMVALDITPFEIGVEYEAKFGPVGAAGMKIFIKMIHVNWNTGQAGIALAASTIIVA